jgi:acetylornithine deacetylase/succinyl-diaminopimelate desuccinylase-like protein
MYMLHHNQQEGQMNRTQALSLAAAYFDEGQFEATLAQRVAIRTESREPASGPQLHAYLEEILVPELQAMGFSCRVIANPVPGQGPFLLAERIEAEAGFTLLTYGHGDVVCGHERQWRAGLAPWTLVVDGDHWYGRGTADNKGQHTINLAALAQVLAVRKGRLGYNVKLLFEMGEETGSPGLAEVCSLYRDALRADLFIASDGPRVAASCPTLFLGSRGGVNFDLRLQLRKGGYHSGNWGGVLRNPGVRLAHAIASMVDERGRILVKPLLPASLPASVRAALQTIPVGGGKDDPEIDPDWGEPGLTPTERVIGWNALEVLAFKTGNPDAPVNAIPASAHAHCQIRYVVGSDSANFLKHIRAHLDQHGYTDVEVVQNGPQMEATRLDPDDPWVSWGLASMQASSGVTPALLPNLGGTLPNDVFACLLQLPTLWIPHSYPACAQHAANEHLLGSVARESLQIMAGIFWDLGEGDAQAIAASRRQH